LANAAELFSEDFESNTLSAWQCFDCVRGPSSIATSNAAAHRGAFGGELIDAENITGAGSGAAASVVFSASSAVYVRAWVRVAETNGLGDTVLLNIINSAQNLNNVYLAYPDGSLSLAGSQQPDVFSRLPTGFALALGDWHLLEAAATGGGTDAGVRTLWVDGVQKATQTGLAWSGADWIASTFILGQAWSTDRRYVGKVDFDDLRISTEPMGSVLAVTASPPLTQGGCVPLTVELRDSVANAPAAAPYALDVAVSGPGAVFDDAACTHAIDSVRIDKGARLGTAFGRFDARGSVVLVASHPDFLSASSMVQISESAALRSFYAISCASAPLAPEGLVLILLLARASTRTSSRCGAHRAWRCRRSAPSWRRSDRSA
jgi:hypothetical protein